MLNACLIHWQKSIYIPQSRHIRGNKKPLTLWLTYIKKAEQVWHLSRFIYVNPLLLGKFEKGKDRVN
jgi:hypothetical protein